MKALLKIIVIILVTASVMLLSACNEGQTTPNGGENSNNSPYFYPEGYTCGFPEKNTDPEQQIEYWWVETYDECLAAMELLKSHESVFSSSQFFAYEGDLFDTKYCFEISRFYDCNANIKFGDDPFDRFALYVTIYSYAFFEDVTIEEINHGDINDYEHCRISSSCLKELEAFPLENIECEWNEEKRCYYVLDNRELPSDLISVGGEYYYYNEAIYQVVDGKRFIFALEVMEEETFSLKKEEYAWAIANSLVRIAWLNDSYHE